MRISDDPRSCDIDIDHSLRGGLLGRLVAGKHPLPFPPPKAFSRGWYSLIDTGEGTAHECWCWDRPPGEPLVIGDAFVVNQHGGWRLEAIDGTALILSYPNYGRWRATPSDRTVSGEGWSRVIREWNFRREA